MAKARLVFRDVSFGYDSAPVDLFENIDIDTGSGWTGVVGANGAGKTSLLLLATGLLKPTAGALQRPATAIYCPQRTDDPPSTLPDFMQAPTKRAYTIRARLEIEPDWPDRWESLSHGERKRLQIAWALWQRPALLALDEPTNHLDRVARDLLGRELDRYSGIGLLVSHDRELLDRLCQQCLFAEPPRVVCRPGGYSKGTRTAMNERRTIVRKREHQKQKLDSLHREMQRRKARARRADRKRSKRGIPRHDRDGRAKIDHARLTGKDKVDGQLQKQLAGRVDQANRHLSQYKVKRELVLGIHFEHQPPRPRWLVSLPAGQLPLGVKRRLNYPDLALHTSHRVGVSGPNGTGKSTLVAALVRHLNLKSSEWVYIPQEIPNEQGQALLESVTTLPPDDHSRVMTLVSRLGSHPRQLLDSREPSPGETRKLLLALGLCRNPALVVMDEPTNHMDLPSVQCLEAALADYPGGLLLVSHDSYFLEQLTQIRWEIVADRNGETSNFVLAVA